MENKIAKECRKFGASVGLVLVGAFGLLLPWLFDRPFPRWPFFVGLPLLFLALTWPTALNPLRRLWMKLAEILGWINSRIILSILFFLVFTPMAFLLRLFRWDPLHLRPSKAATYWQEGEAEPKLRFDRPF